MSADIQFALGAFVAGVLAAWRWHVWRERSRMRGLERVLDALENQQPAEPSLAAIRREASLRPLVPKLVRAFQFQALMRQRIEHEEFSLRTVLSSMEEGVLVLDARHKILLANPAFISGFGLERNPVGRSVLEVLGEPDVHRLFQDALQTGRIQERQMELVPGKRVRFLAVRAVPMSDSEGRPGLLGVFRDETRLQKLEQVRREFVANVSHELRTPLAIFQGYVEHLSDTPELTAPERQEVLDVLMRHSKRLNALVEDLLSLARLEARQEAFHWEILAPGDLVQEILRDWKVRTAGRKVDVSVDLVPGLPEVRVDRLRIAQVLYNLLENALKYVPADFGRIIVHVQSEPCRGAVSAGVRVTVEDNGSGIALRDLPHIFERFYRANKSRGTVAGSSHSTGLGLSIVRHIVAAHGGEVGAESQYGKGTRVWFCLPGAPSEERLETEAPAPAGSLACESPADEPPGGPTAGAPS